MTGPYPFQMAVPRVVAVAPGSPAAQAGLLAGDTVRTLNGTAPRDVLEWRQLADDGELDVEIERDGSVVAVSVAKRPGEPLGVDVQSAVFDQVQTCDNHCEFCFIYQLPPGLRRTLYLKDDDYRLSFLYGNFTTLTRFTEADLERVVTERLSPLNVSIHATDPDVRADMLRNRRGATSLRWLRALLDHGIEVNGQVVVCPGINDGDVLEDTLCGVLDRYPELATLCVVPLGVSRFNREPRMRPHTSVEAMTVVDTVEAWQHTFLHVLGRRLVFAADEYYLLAGRPFPEAHTYEDFTMHEDGIGMARTFECELLGSTDAAARPRDGFFSWVEASTPDETEFEPYRTWRSSEGSCPAARDSCDEAPVAVLTGEYGAAVLAPLIDVLSTHEALAVDVRVVPVENRFFGGTTAVTGLLVGADLARVLAEEPHDHRYLLPDVCLSRGRFLDGTSPDDLPRAVEVIPTDGHALRRALGIGA
jgi:putative radical SAM enzyme (TIGR03279 family)